MNTLKGKRILFFQQRGWGASIGSFLAERLEEEDCKLAAFTLKKTTDAYIRNSGVSYDMIVSNDAVMEDPLGYLAGDRYSIQEICDALGVDTIWPLVITLRNHVRTYEEKYYYSYLQKLPDEEILLYVQAMYKCVKVFFEEFKPDMIIGLNFVALPHIMFNLYAEQKGVPMIAFTDCKVKGLYIFTEGYRDDKGAFYDRVDALNKGEVHSENAEKARTYISEFRKEFKRPDYALGPEEKQGVWKTLKYHLKPYVDCYRFYRYPNVNRLKNLGITVDYRPPYIILRDHYAHARNKRFADNFSYVDLGKIGKYAYFPLQFQPESNIDAVSPYYNNQLDLARQFALALPGDYTLVVKEHPAMIGLRSPGFYRKLARTPNVKIVDYRTPSEIVLKGADIILSINGTAIAEAAFFSKPAIQVGTLGTTRKLPNVTQHTDITSLSAKIKEVLSISLGGDAYERRLEHFIAAAYDTGFPMRYLTDWGTPQEDREMVWNLYKEEILRQ